jgi:dTDP-N-acetylfucosamine:lipid II N-acetylfucosaminyltransferase
MFLHLICNDLKFPVKIRRKYDEIDPGNHAYVIIKVRPDQAEWEEEGFDYVVTPDELDLLIRSRSDWEGIIINGLLFGLFAYLPVIPKDLPTAYFIWGVEAYVSVFSLSSKLFAPRTRRVLESWPTRIRIFLSSMIGPRARLRRQSREVSKIVDVACFSIREEVEFFIEKGVLPRSVRYHRANVGRGHVISEASSLVRVTGQNILVGNSADPHNNHLDTFAWLVGQNLDLSDRKIIVPLSYGGDDAYKKKIISEGHESFGNSFAPILEFLPMDDYMRLLSSASCVVMNHYRQQGAGNIFIALKHGSSVYLNERTTLSRGLKRLGFRIGDVSEGCELRSFSDDDLNHNYALFRNFFSRERSYENTKQLLLLLKNLGNRPIDESTCIET